MSLDLFVCALDLEKFCAVQGSGDHHLFKSIAEKMHAEIENYDRQFLGSEPGAQPLASVIEQIVDGTLLPETARFQFEAAATMIADALGYPLPVETLREAKGAFCDEVDYLVSSLRDANGITAATLPSIGAILERGPLLQIPLDLRLGLGSGYLTVPEVARAARVLAGLDLEEPVVRKRLKWPELAPDAISEYRGWLTAAAKLELGLFMHR